MKHSSKLEALTNPNFVVTLVNATTGKRLTVAVNADDAWNARSVAVAVAGKDIVTSGCSMDYEVVEI